MDEYRIEFSGKAKRDMLDIHAYIAGNLQEPGTADRLLDRIEAGIQTLGYMPLRYAIEQSEHLKLKDMRKMLVDNYLVFFTVDEEQNTVFIIRVLYARRDWMNLL